MPTDRPMEMSPSTGGPRRMGWSTAVMSREAIASATAAPPGTRAVNSSPPRPARSPAPPRVWRRRSATSTSTRSPVAWPWRSLTGLNRSRSRNSTATARCPPALLEAGAEQPPVGHAGEPVVGGHVGELLVLGVADERQLDVAERPLHDELVGGDRRHVDGAPDGEHRGSTAADVGHGDGPAAGDAGGLGELAGGRRQAVEARVARLAGAGRLGPGPVAREEPLGQAGAGGAEEHLAVEGVVDRRAHRLEREGDGGPEVVEHLVERGTRRERRQGLVEEQLGAPGHEPQRGGGDVGIVEQRRGADGPPARPPVGAQHREHGGHADARSSWAARSARLWMAVSTASGLVKSSTLRPTSCSAGRAEVLGGRRVHEEDGAPLVDQHRGDAHRIHHLAGGRRGEARRAHPETRPRSKVPWRIRSPRAAVSWRATVAWARSWRASPQPGVMRARWRRSTGSTPAVGEAVPPLGEVAPEAQRAGAVERASGRRWAPRPTPPSPRPRGTAQVGRPHRTGDADRERQQRRPRPQHGAPVGRARSSARRRRRRPRWRRGCPRGGRPRPRC